MRGKGKEPREGVWVSKEGLSPSEALLRDCRTGFKGRKWEYLPISSCVCDGGGQLRALITAGRQAGRTRTCGQRRASSRVTGEQRGKSSASISGAEAIGDVTTVDDKLLRNPEEAK